MATWQAIVDGTTYSLSDGNPFKVLSISGIGNAPVRRLEERGPFQDGSTDIGYRLDARLINIAIQITGASLSATDGHRDTLSRIFNPRNGQIVYLRCTRDDGAVRQIDCYAVNMVDMPAELGQRDMAAQRVGVQLKAPNPIWYNPTAVVSSFVPTVSTAWHLIGGLIGTADILTFGTAIGANVVWTAGTIAPGDDYSIVYRAAGSAAATNGAAWSYASLNAGQSYLAQLWAGTAYLQEYPYSLTMLTPAGTPVIVINRDDSGVQIYRDNVLVASVPNSGSAGILSGTWNNSVYGVAWGTISHGAVYRKALNENARTSLQNILTVGGTAAGGGTVTNSGSWDEYPIITIPGAASSPIITNTTTGEVLDFTGSTIPAGQTYTIDTRYGYKTVTDSGAVNRIAALSNSSDLASFHLAPGINAIEVANAATLGTVTITSYDRYLGL